MSRSGLYKRVEQVGQLGVDASLFVGGFGVFGQYSGIARDFRGVTAVSAELQQMLGGQHSGFTSQIPVKYENPEESAIPSWKRISPMQSHLDNSSSSLSDWPAKACSFVKAVCGLRCAL